MRKTFCTFKTIRLLLFWKK